MTCINCYIYAKVKTLWLSDTKTLKNHPPNEPNTIASGDPLAMNMCQNKSIFENWEAYILILIYDGSVL